MRDAVEASIRSGEEYEIEYRLVTLKEETRWAYIRAQTSFSTHETPETLFGVSADTTERRRTETALRDAADRLALVTELAGVETWEVNLCNHQLILPARMRAMMGLSTDRPIGTRAIYRTLASEERVTALAAFQAAVDPFQRALFKLECRSLKTLRAKVHCVLIKGRGIFDNKGRCLRVMEIAKDISDPCVTPFC
jgi:PAS domain-containing protein